MKTQPFGVTSESFTTYVKFKEAAEKLGVKYNNSFTLFREDSMRHNECIWIDKGWKDEDFIPTEEVLIAFSNAEEDAEVINLDTDFDKAIEQLTKFQEENPFKEVEKVEMTQRDIERELGYRIKIIK